MGSAAGIRTHLYDVHHFDPRHIGSMVASLQLNTGCNEITALARIHKAVHATEDGRLLDVSRPAKDVDGGDR